ncbi:C1q-like domain-containing protein [Pyxidicoccus trucidator]|uniref:C1q-like domain-containing protein n=1 Tax=Pyxidicoccus trucidator TaxID=2709662 RepID=UPI0013DA186C|nr:hypothetical protein [Pyxidicoccus trucidator]
MQRPWKTLVFGIASSLIASAAQAEGSDAAVDGARMSGQVIHDYRTADPVLPAYLATYNPYLCPESGIVAFSVSGGNHVSEGGATLLGYPHVITNEGANWPTGGGTFVAPCAGLYFFAVSFVKDATNYGATNRDVYVQILQNGVSKGLAWSGYTADQDRAAGSYSVALVLEQGDYIQTFTFNDTGVKRHLYSYNFTGHLVRQRY